MSQLSKKERARAYATWRELRRRPRRVTAPNMIAKFWQLFRPEMMSAADKKKVKETAALRGRDTLACYNLYETAVLVCRKNKYTLGLTRDMYLLDLTDDTCYKLKCGCGYRQVQGYIATL